MSIFQEPVFTDLVTLRAATMDDIASIRYVHAAAFRILAGEQHTEEQVDAFVNDINAPEYSREIHDSDLTIACLDNEIIGTAGWCPADDQGRTARIRKVFVRPLFTRCGVGTMLVEAVSARAERAGFKDFSVRANMNALPFFEKIGFEITSYGVMPTKGGEDLPVAFMRRYEMTDRKPIRVDDTTLSGKIKSVTHESYWHHPTEH